jgi:hypothetical protein
MAEHLRRANPGCPTARIGDQHAEHAVDGRNGDRRNRQCGRRCRRWSDRNVYRVDRRSSRAETHHRRSTSRDRRRNCTTTPAPAAGASGAATTTAGAATTTTGGAIATWVTDKIKDRIKSDLEVSASTLAGNVAGQTPSQQFVNAQQEALLNAKNSAQLEFNTHMGRFRTSPHGYEEARGLRDSNAEAARTRANPAQHAASLAEWARTGQGRSAGVLEIIDEINHRNFGETSLVVNVDMPEPNSDVHVQSARWPALNDATRQALRSRHASMRIEEFNPAMRIRIYTQRWRPFIGESYFDLTKIPGQSNVEFEHTGTPLLFLFQRQNPGGSPSTTPVDVQQSAAQVAAQMIWLGIWHSQIGRLGEISG